jgi:hypothetical protein
MTYINITFLVLEAVDGEDFVPMHAIREAKRGHVIDVRARIDSGGNAEIDTRIFPPCDPTFMWAIGVCLLYPTFYDGYQLLK